MSIAAISVTNPTYVRPAFTGRRNEEKANYEDSPKSSVSGLAKVPVIVLMAMTPGLNNNINAQNDMTNGYRTELLAQNIDNKTYDASNNPNYYNHFGVRSLGKRSFLESNIIKCNNGQKYNLYFKTYSYKKGNDVDAIYLFKCFQNGDIDKNKYPLAISNSWLPPRVEALIYHDLGEGKEFLGVRVKEKVKSSCPGNYAAHKYYEIKIDDEKFGQYLIDLLTGDTKWMNSTGIKFEETKSPNLEKMKIVDRNCK